MLFFYLRLFFTDYWYFRPDESILFPTFSIIMRTLLLSTLLFLFILACGSNGAPEANKEVAKAEKPDGAQIYKNLCVACHGLYGDMGASGAFNLQTSALNLEERIAVITNGRNTMTPFGSMLKEEEIKAVAEYTLTLKK